MRDLDLAGNARAHNTRLLQHIHALETRLSESLGETVFRESGLGAPDDIHSLQQTLADREQQLLELRRQLEERDDELAAARAANRELMTQLNTGVTQKVQGSCSTSPGSMSARTRTIRNG
jgi:chromosome segregation ATPase